MEKVKVKRAISKMATLQEQISSLEIQQKECREVIISAAQEKMQKSGENTVVLSALDAKCTVTLARTFKIANAKKLEEALGKGYCELVEEKTAHSLTKEGKTILWGLYDDTAEIDEKAKTDFTRIIGARKFSFNGKKLGLFRHGVALSTTYKVSVEDLL